MNKVNSFTDPVRVVGSRPEEETALELSIVFAIADFESALAGFLKKQATMPKNFVSCLIDLSVCKGSQIVEVGCGKIFQVLCKVVLK